MFTVKRAVAAVLTVVVPLAAVPWISGSTAVAATPIASAVIGTSVDTAAGSCWEVKQKRPSAANGSYWLLTPAMSKPAQFYCDMTTDGGGWVLVGKGREGWTTDYLGTGDAAELQSPTTVPMSSATHQLPSPVIDQLLNNKRVDQLSEGVRVRRATNRDGTSWQEARMRFSRKGRWTWTFGAEHPLAGWQLGTSIGFSGTTPTFGIGQSLSRMVNTTDSSKRFMIGFGYGTQVAGYTDPSSHLWAATNGAGGALPYAQVYLRPRVTSTDAGFTAIPDSGTPRIEQPEGVDSNALPSSWGVSGLKGNTASEGNVEVQAFTQSGSRMYVGGNFRYVQRDAAGSGQVEQSFLAAFDLATGEWDPSFRPVLNEQVNALATLPDGSVVAGGSFSEANGAPATAIVALDPLTGATKQGWNLKLENRITGGVLRVRSLDVTNGKLYIGGALTHMSGGQYPNRAIYTKNAGRVDAATATPSADWNPEFNGTVIAMDGSDDAARLYAAGHFSTSKTSAALRVAAVLTDDGAPLATPAWTPTWSSTGANYQQAIRQVGDKVFSGGSEHALFQYDTSTFSRLSGNITKQGGDFQSADSDGELLLAGCHCGQWTYSNAYTWSSIGTGWTEADAIRWVGAWDASTGAYVPSFNPSFTLRLDSGIWAVKTDTAGNFWVGGDIVNVRTANGRAFSGGFARFRRSDSTAPDAPSGLTVADGTADTATLTWNPVTDPAGGVRYELLRDDRTVAFTTEAGTQLTVPRVVGGRYFVRAVDRKGNVSASSPVLVMPAEVPNQAPVAAFASTTKDLTVDLDASTSTDDRGVTSYAWTFGDGESGTGATTSHTYAAGGSHEVTLTVTDAQGLTSSVSRTVEVKAPDPQVIALGSAWHWYYQAAAPAATWRNHDFDDAAWSSGNGTFGWGAPTVATRIDAAFASETDRPVTAYFRKSFQVDDPSRVVSLRLDTVADDGAVVHVNGVEVARQNMGTGVVGHTTYAQTARRYTAAAADPLVVEVPLGLLRAGTNVVAVETHVNYRRTPDLTFDLKATLVAR
ncbi:fibrinogen-like YCDxxxxGGGW domain-containing protein [Nocardioides daphniae]|uniref:PKD domain-containing protein n=1 Tax=Nocardioides daphniae TaxID=402297 RepID=A0A4P7UB91_9ACTN|nr:fibrinogen-like YCDxxxxGGGW domain-containing protein [Nocardioides daphniae]QCC76565.1 PKD domain-containing protein [Nocardioides daphniae]GGD05294.1 hypothetical protein GCM10007231_00090 [Nocardioides daphniae]